MNDLKEKQQAALYVLSRYRRKITRQQFKTLKGQVLTGDPDGAMKGLKNILKREERSQ